MKDKIMSGRYFLTVVCGIVFAYVSIYRIIPAEAIIAIISTVFTAYFNRNDRQITQPQWRARTAGLMYSVFVVAQTITDIVEKKKEG